MKTLILMRHAKSSWDHPALGDHQRPLNARGRRDGPVLARWLVTEDCAPDVVITSDAQRAVETWETMAADIPLAQASLRADLYHAAPDAILRVVRQAPDCETLLIIGHEPGISSAVERLARPSNDAAYRAALDHFPTGGMAILRFAGIWSAAAPGLFRFENFVAPRAIQAERTALQAR